jgi:hypothetical protein
MLAHDEPPVASEVVAVGMVAMEMTGFTTTGGGGADSLRTLSSTSSIVMAFATCFPLYEPISNSTFEPSKRFEVLHVFLAYCVLRVGTILWGGAK